MLKTIEDDSARLSLLGNYLENIKGTVFRQTQFAEFEWRAHQMAEKGQPLTGESLDKLYLDITRKYYGHDKGVCIVDDYVQHEWASERDEAVSRVPRGRRVEVPDRTAQGCRCGHDHNGASPAHAGENELRHGRDGRAAG